MASWREIEQEAAEFAAKVKARFEAGTNKTLATLRRDGAPRISGSEATFQDGELTFGMMPGSVKLLDVRRDPRIAMHSPTIEPPEGHRRTGRATRNWPARPWRSRRRRTARSPARGTSAIDITEVTLTYVGDPPDHLVIESWHAGRGHSRRIRR